MKLTEIITVALAILFCLFSTEALAITAGKEAEMCEVEERITAPDNQDMRTSLWFDAGACIGAMQTFIGILAPLKHGAPNTIKGICAPESISVGQGIKIFLKWAQDNPNKLQYLHTDGFIESFKEAFPCSKR